MKKITKFAALFAASAFLFGGILVSCADGGYAVATPTTYNFVGLTSITGLTLAASGTTNFTAGSTTTVAGATLYSGGSNNGYLRARTDENKATTAINYNGGCASYDLTQGIAIKSLDRYIKISVDGAGTLTASYKVVKSTSASGDLGQIAFIDGDGKLIGSANTGLKLSSGDGSTETLTVTTTGACDAYLAFSRNGAGAGGIDVYSIEVK